MDTFLVHVPCSVRATKHTTEKLLVIYLKLKFKQGPTFCLEALMWPPASLYTKSKLFSFRCETSGERFSEYNCRAQLVVTEFMEEMGSATYPDRNQKNLFLS